MDRLSRTMGLNPYVLKVIDKFRAQPLEGSRLAVEARNKFNTQVATLSGSLPYSMEFLTSIDGSGIFYSDDDDGENTLTLFDFEMTFCGAAPERHCSAIIPEVRSVDGYDDGHIRDSFNRAVLDTVVTPENPEDDLWTSLESLYYMPLSSDALDTWHRLEFRSHFRQSVAIAFLFSSELAPFTIPAAVFHHAAYNDLDYMPDFERDTTFSMYSPRYIHYLFEIDPTSLPRKDPIFQQWAVKACERIRHFPRAFHHGLWELSDEHDENSWSYTQYQRQLVMSRYVFDVEVRMIRYIKTGESPYPADRPAPHLHDPILQMQVTTPSNQGIRDPIPPGADEVDVHDEEQRRLAEEEYACKLRSGPNPPELGFLNETDFRRDQILCSLHPQDIHPSFKSEEERARGGDEAWEGSDAVDEELDGMEQLINLDDYEVDNYEHARNSLDLISLRFQRGKNYWWKGDDCYLNSTLERDIEWYNRT